MKMTHEFNIHQIVNVKMPGGEEFEAMVYGFGTDGMSYLVKNLPEAVDKWQKVIAEEWITVPGAQLELIKKVREAGL